MLFKDSVGILERSNGTHSLLVKGRTSNDTTNSLIIKNAADTSLLEVWNDGNIKLAETIGRVTVGNYENLTANFAVGGSSELIGTVDVTGDTSITGDLDLLGSLQIQDGTETDGYVLTAGTNGNASWQALPDTQTGAARKDTFTADGLTTNFTLTYEPNYVYYISVNGVIQEEGVHYVITGVNLTFADVLVDDYVIIASYAQNLVDVNLTGDATDINYTPNDGGDWSPQPVDVQEALDQLAADASSMNIGSTLFVSPTGDNGTAVRGDMNHPYSTISAAKTATGTNDLIIVYPGTYDDAVLAATSGVLYYFFLPGARIVNTSTDHIFSISTGNETYVYGSGYFECTEGSAAVAIHVSSSIFNFQFLKCKAINTVFAGNGGTDWILDGDEVECTGTGEDGIIISGQLTLHKAVHNGSSSGIMILLASNCNININQIEANNANGAAMGINASSNNCTATIGRINSSWQGFRWSTSTGSNCNIKIGSIVAVDHCIPNAGSGLSDSVIEIGYAQSTSNRACSIVTSGNNTFKLGRIISDTAEAINISGNDSLDIYHIDAALGAVDVAIIVNVSSAAPSAGLVDLVIAALETVGRIQITAANSTYFHLNLVIDGGIIIADDYPIQVKWEASTQANRFNLNNVRMRCANGTASIHDNGGVSPELATFFCVADSEADASIINNGLPLVINSYV